MNGLFHLHGRRIWATALLVAALFAPAATAQELYTFTATGMLGLGGSPDAEPGDSLDNTGVQLGFSMVTESRTQLALRLGRLDLDADRRFGPLTSAELTYLTIAGEYRFTETYYESGIYLGLGGYRLDGDAPGGAGGEETALGAVLGLVGEFKINRRFSVQVELSGHYADLEPAQTFLMGHAGVAYHF